MSKKEIFNQLKQSIKLTSTKEKCSKFFLWCGFIYSFIFESFTPKQFIALKIYRYKHIEKRKNINHWRAKKIDEVFNNDAVRKFFDDKCLFNITFSENVKRHWINLKEWNKNSVSDFLNVHYEVIAKPNDLSGGRGIFKTSNISDIILSLGQDYLLEEVIINHKEISKFCPNVCNTIRIYSFVDKNKNIDLIVAYLKIGLGKTGTDNMYNGGGEVLINLDSAIIIGPKKNYYGLEEKINSHTKKVILASKFLFVIQF